MCDLSDGFIWCHSVSLRGQGKPISCKVQKNNPHLSKSKIKQKWIYWKIKERAARIWILLRMSDLQLALKIPNTLLAGLCVSLPLTYFLLLQPDFSTQSGGVTSRSNQLSNHSRRIWAEISFIHYLWLLWLQCWESLLSSLNTNYWILLLARYFSMSYPWLTNFSPHRNYWRQSCEVGVISYYVHFTDDEIEEQKE